MNILKNKAFKLKTLTWPSIFILLWIFKKYKKENIAQWSIGTMNNISKKLFNKYLFSS